MLLMNRRRTSDQGPAILQGADPDIALERRFTQPTTIRPARRFASRAKEACEPTPDRAAVDRTFAAALRHWLGLLQGLQGRPFDKHDD